MSGHSKVGHKETPGDRYGIDSISGSILSTETPIFWRSFGFVTFESLMHRSPRVGKLVELADRYTQKFVSPESHISHRSRL
jgi:hypothetical protein